MTEVHLGCDKIGVNELVCHLTGVPSLSVARQVIVTCAVEANGMPIEMGDEVFLGEELKEITIKNDTGKTKTWLVGK